MFNSRPAFKSLTQAKGIGLIEVLIAMFVLAVGVLALGQLQGDFFGTSAASKSRTEALAIAQGRLEDMRNYMHEAESLDEFNALYPVDTDFNLATIDGVNASFSRKETITANGDLRTVAVTVEWEDATGKTQGITLDTELTFIPPGAAGTLAVDRDDLLVPSPTGRAKLGKGTVPDGAPTTSNGDGTKMYISGEDKSVVSGQKIVLTLEDACNTAGEDCEDFVQIKGKVYIDNATQGSLDPEDVFVQASDASYCTRYYFDSLGASQTIDNATGTDLLSSSGDYSYFHYTCYLGGGWHGNVGLLITGGIKQTDKVCQGDPVSTDHWDAPVIAVRRTYRGMVYEKDSSGAAVTTAGGDYVYTSYGIGDGIVLPDPDTSDHSHDFVVSSMSTNSTEGSNCISQGVMVRADATSDTPGDLFQENPHDFVCLNNGYLDSYDSSKYGHDLTCPYDPTDPPVALHIVSGVVDVDVTDSSVLSADIENILSSIGVNTSDGPGNCLLSEFDAGGSGYQASYACDVYDWGTGWNGMITTSATGNELKLFCDPSPLELTSVGENKTNQNIDCFVGNYARISGRVTTPNPSKVLETVTISGGVCRLGDAGLSYECITDAFTDVAWDGSLTFTLSDGVLCPEEGATTSGTLVLDSGVATATDITGFNQLDINIQNNVNHCSL
ncbi:type IV pilus modification protein PilV [Microbulbifer donghaiensis]|uniref:Type IV pilus modification protein PilV n=1 Tax=Microbulbifer donghaiensis TaxID=494016 RepID=A0A1M5HEP3_9GAMM|nr:hypothetical protein [Microbulbifer donghaiensis]SHG14348.1 type IV pilus modification protein PilV [Microbulbifer donghaiensis]